MKIIFKNDDNSIGIITPVITTKTIEEIVKKDVPSGLPYWIVEDSEISTDREFRNAWEIGDDMGEPNGYGAESNTF